MAEEAAGRLDVVIADEDVQLVRWAPSLASQLPPLANDRRVWRNLRDGFPSPYLQEHATGFIEMASTPARCNAAGIPYFLAVVVGGALAGGAGVMAGEDVHRHTFELGYWLGAPFWGRGIATRVVALITRLAFDSHGALRVEAAPFARNAASRRVLVKNGFKFEGTHRCAAVKDGKIEDMAMYAVVAKDRKLPTTATAGHDVDVVARRARRWGAAVAVFLAAAAVAVATLSRRRQQEAK
jgi:ribosomal-protein-alanine N-acetyltransferase